MFCRRLFITICVGLLALAGIVVARPPNVHFVDVRALGMGGAGLTTMNDFGALMYNPALLAKSGFHLDLVNIQVRFSKDILNMFNFYNDNQDVFDNFIDTTLAAQQNLLDGLAPYDDKWMGIGAYPQVGLTFPHFALGAYGSANMEFKADKGVFEPRAYLHAIGDYVFTGGLAIKLPHSLSSNLLPNDLYAGAAVKIITRYEVEEVRLAASDVDLETAFDTLIEESRSGFGIDLGFLYELVPNRIDLGVRVVDLVADIGGDKPPTIFNVGASLKLSRRLVFAADYNDFFFHRGENIFNKLYFGAEFNLAHILTLRGGFAQGYPSAGAGLNAGVLAIDAAIYSIEKSSSPGRDRDCNYALRLKLGI